ncbi:MULTISPECIES: hypothetical protein [Streptomyces]|uniref:hypothetical protein n=1 Tax=Streptomyces TaxID=1883 RepID=UPI000E39BEAD|nr:MULTISPECIES: hypothetical protein [Streptomyces]NDZ62716.1 hypothetical protein [Streptomyces cyaneofuscatus]RDV51233.1 hypothetical protein DDV98_14220 [Streptomyces sp. IB2014 011-12]WSI53191.1 hypothetical protein OG366_02770 [Streptomyces cyaneofuscatus]WTF40324.1 hypothetical protein OG973_33785 [Streptomyces cyaneofuscatus]
MAQDNWGCAVRRTILEQFPAGDPRGSWAAEEFAAARRGEGLAAEVVMNLDQDVFLVVVPQQTADAGR